MIVNVVLICSYSKIVGMIVRFVSIQMTNAHSFFKNYLAKLSIGNDSVFSNVIVSAVNICAVTFSALNYLRLNNIGVKINVAYARFSSATFWLYWPKARMTLFATSAKSFFEFPSQTTNWVNGYRSALDANDINHYSISAPIASYEESLGLKINLYSLWYFRLLERSAVLIHGLKRSIPISKACRCLGDTASGDAYCDTFVFA